MSSELSDSQLHWRCRRGVRELDVLFTRFLETTYYTLSKEEQLSFQALLEVQDPTIMDWLMGKVPPEKGKESIVKCLQELSGL